MIEILQKGGWIMLPLFAFSINSLSLVFYLTHQIFFQSQKKNISKLYRVNGWLSHTATLSTLTGLLGTVLGIQSSFENMQIAGKASIEIFAAGISQALITTIFGLTIAIPSTLFYHFFYDRLEESEEVDL